MLANKQFMLYSKVIMKHQASRWFFQCQAFKAYLGSLHELSVKHPFLEVVAKKDR